MLAELSYALNGQINSLSNSKRYDIPNRDALIDELIQLDMQLVTDMELQDSIDQSVALCG